VIGRILSDNLVDLIKKSAPCKDVTRAHLCTLRFEGGEVISTDGHRIHRLPAAPATSGGIEDCTVPIWTLEAALASLQGSTGAVTITPDGKHVEVSTTNGTIRTEQPKFPPFQQVRPGGGPAFTIELNLRDAQRELRRLRKAGDAVVLGGTLYCPADGPSREVLRFRAITMPSMKAPEAPAEWDAPAPDVWGGQIGFQADYLLDALAAAKWSHKIAGSDARTVTLKIHGTWTHRDSQCYDPAVLVWDGGDAVIMPVRL
jgi:hypothetical protein